MKTITSEAPTSTKWVDVRKMNDDGEEFMRSRLVARGFRPRRGPDRPDLFAAMPEDALHHDGRRGCLRAARIEG